MRFEFQVARFADMLMPLRCDDGSALWPAAWWCDLARACARAHALVWRRGRGAARTIGADPQIQGGIGLRPFRATTKAAFSMASADESGCHDSIRQTMALLL